MKVGSIVFATEQGLGYLAKDFYDNGILTDVMILHHGRRTTHIEWYPEDTIQITTRPFINEQTIEFVKSMDTMLFFETPFSWEFFNVCREHNTLSVLMPMHECMPAVLPQLPDRYLCPSQLEVEIYGGEYIPIPVDVKWKLRHVAHTFVHNAGNLGLKGRNGTSTLLAAMRYVASPIKLIVRAQSPLPLAVQGKVDDRVDLRIGTVDKEELYEEGEVFVFPEKFNGLSLPLQEAYASGMLVMSTKRFPITEWLPSDPLINVRSYRTSHISRSCRTFKEAVVNPVEIARCIDDWYEKDVADFSLRGKDWAQRNSWDNLKDKYREVLTP